MRMKRRGCGWLNYVKCSLRKRELGLLYMLGNLGVFASLDSIKCVRIGSMEVRICG